MYEKTPLSKGFTLAGVVGMVVFGLLLYGGSINKTWGFLLLLLSAIIFIASMVSITPRLPKEKDLDFEHDMKRIKEDYEKINKELSVPMDTFSNHIGPVKKSKKKKSTKKKTAKKTTKKKKGTKTTTKKKTQKKKTTKKTKKKTVKKKKK